VLLPTVRVLYRMQHFALHKKGGGKGGGKWEMEVERRTTSYEANVEVLELKLHDDICLVMGVRDSKGGAPTFSPHNGRLAARLSTHAFRLISTNQCFLLIYILAYQDFC
jgi:hypothetical protein